MRQIADFRSGFVRLRNRSRPGRSFRARAARRLARDADRLVRRGRGIYLPARGQVHAAEASGPVYREGQIVRFCAVQERVPGDYRLFVPGQLVILTIALRFETVFYRERYCYF